MKSYVSIYHDSIKSCIYPVHVFNLRWINDNLRFDCSVYTSHRAFLIDISSLVPVLST
jgi:hypothetical protein